MVNKWIIFLADKYILSGKSDNRNAAQKLSIAGLAAGVITLVAVMSIMNGLQLGFINDILEIESYHLRIEKGDFDINNIDNTFNISSITQFSDAQTLIKGKSSNFDPVMVRAIDTESALKDEKFVRHLNITAGRFIKSNAPEAVIGYELSRFLNIRIGDTVSLISFTGESFSGLRPENLEFTVTGFFKSGYYEFDKGLVFIPLEYNNFLQAGYSSSYYGVKLKNLSRDIETAYAVNRILPDAEVVTWRDYNRSFFSVLRMEKMTLMLLITLIFLVIGVNIYNSIKRAAAEKMEDIAVLYSLGASVESVRKIFLIEGIIIGMAGGFIGIVAGILVTININEIFIIAGAAAEIFAAALGYLSSAAGFTSIRSFTLFPQEYFYLSEVPVKLLLPELVMIFVFAFMSSVISAYIASRKISVVNPAEYLRFE